MRPRWIVATEEFGVARGPRTQPRLTNVQRKGGQDLQHHITFPTQLKSRPAALAACPLVHPPAPSGSNNRPDSFACLATTLLTRLQETYPVEGLRRAVVILSW